MQKSDLFSYKSCLLVKTIDGKDKILAEFDSAPSNEALSNLTEKYLKDSIFELIERLSAIFNNPFVTSFYTSEKLQYRAQLISRLAVTRNCKTAKELARFIDEYIVHYLWALCPSNGSRYHKNYVTNYNLLTKYLIAIGNDGVCLNA